MKSKAVYLFLRDTGSVECFANCKRGSNPIPDHKVGLPQCFFTKTKLWTVATHVLTGSLHWSSPLPSPTLFCLSVLTVTLEILILFSGPDQ